VGIGRFASGVKARELLGKLGEARVRRGDLLLAEEKKDEADQIGGGEDKQGCEHIRFSFSPEDNAG